MTRRFTDYIPGEKNLIESETYELTAEFYQREKRKMDKFQPTEVSRTRSYSILAFDVETYERNGNLLCLGISDGNKLVLKNDTRSSSCRPKTHPEETSWR